MRAKTIAQYQSYFGIKNAKDLTVLFDVYKRDVDRKIPKPGSDGEFLACVPYALKCKIEGFKNVLVKRLTKRKMSRKSRQRNRG